ncbi:hypothetical protein DEJ30_08105 [Curtobacterium sp. MCPF17_003]|uniref:hypothetical protein n=1 Tax=Curtobacterium sp. MCPF17_003 TaxID=2175637 RepID=UPI000D8C5705|nr:hypothetical protein [Curtobacterium sp. MCPF17_003]PYY64418.1 hypothetical protein DEJ30_08105 [Curtobacterium sp. MCPF17_003]
MSSDATDRSALVRTVHDAWDRRLRLVHITIADEDGDGYPSFDVDRWVIEVRVPLTDDEAEAAPVARVTAFTVRAPDEVEEIVEALQTSDAQGAYLSVVTGTDPNGGPFVSLFAGAAEVLERDDLLIIDRIEVGHGFEDLPHLAPAIVTAVQNGPAGRTAAFVLADPAHWNIALSDDDLGAINLAPWADTGVLVGVNADPHEAHERAADLIAARTAEDAPSPGTRHGEMWVSEILDRAAEEPALAVPFALPPALPAHISAGAPAGLLHVDADPDTGTLTIQTDEGEFEVVGLPGNAPQLVGAAVGTAIQTQAWLRAVHERWWTYQPALHDRVHEVDDRFLDGTLELATDDSEPHLHMSNLEVRRSAWPLPGELTVEPVREDAEPLVLAVRLDEDGILENVGAIIVHENGQVEAFLHDEWQPWLQDHERAVQHLLSLGVEEFIVGVLHDELDAGVTGVILTGDVDGH